MIDNQYLTGGGQRLRLPWIDWAKTIGIYLVVLGHIHYLKGTIFISLFHMPYFFMLSGYLYKRIGFKSEILRSFKSLIAPYLFFNVVLLLVAFFVGEFQPKMIKNILMCNYELFPVRYFSPLWFLVSLFLMRMICSVIPEKYYGYALLFVCLLSCALFYTHLFPRENESDYFQWATTCICLPSFLFGWITKKCIILSIPDKIKPVVRYPLLLFTFIIVVIVGRLNGFINVFKCTVGKDIVVYYLVSTTLSLILMYLFSKIFTKEIKVVKAISIGTILILGLHVAMIDGLGWGLPKNSAIALALSLVIMAICYLLILFTLNYYPFIIGRSSKYEKMDRPL